MNRQRWQASLIRTYGRPWTTLGNYVFHPSRPEEKQPNFYLGYQSPEATGPNHLLITVPAKRRKVAASWGGPRVGWKYDPQAVKFLLEPKNDQIKEVVDRETAERFAREAKVDLPTEEQLEQIRLEAERRNDVL